MVLLFAGCMILATILNILATIPQTDSEIAREMYCMIKYSDPLLQDMSENIHKHVIQEIEQDTSIPPTILNCYIIRFYRPFFVMLSAFCIFFAAMSLIHSIRMSFENRFGEKKKIK